MKYDKDFLERRERRLNEWTGGNVAGKNDDVIPLSGKTPEENLADLETLRRMVYPELESGKMDKSVGVLHR